MPLGKEKILMSVKRSSSKLWGLTSAFIIVSIVCVWENEEKYEDSDLLHGLEEPKNKWDRKLASKMHIKTDNKVYEYVYS